MLKPLLFWYRESSYCGFEIIPMLHVVKQILLISYLSIVSIICKKKKNTNFVYCCQVNRYWLKSKKIKSFIGNFINVKNMM